MKLKVGGKVALVCSYCVGAGSELTSNTFRRRAYWADQNPNYIFVHYLDLEEKHPKSEQSSQLDLLDKPCSNLVLSNSKNYDPDFTDGTKYSVDQSPCLSGFKKIDATFVDVDHPLFHESPHPD